MIINCFGLDTSGSPVVVILLLKMCIEMVNELMSSR